MTHVLHTFIDNEYNHMDHPTIFSGILNNIKSFHQTKTEQSPLNLTKENAYVRSHKA